VCGSGSHQVWLKKSALRLVRCWECGMIFANPVERTFLDGQFYKDRAGSYYLSRDKLESDYAPVRFERELRLFRRFCQSGDVLDVGCSTGGFLHQLSMRFQSDYRVTGIDLAGQALDYAATRGVPVIREPYLEFDFGEQRFDAITLWAVLEHLAAPAAFTAKSAALLKPGGHLFVLVPNMRSLAARLLGWRYRYLMAEHLNYFTAQTLIRLGTAEDAIEVAALHSMHFNPVVLWQDWWRGGSEVSDLERADLLRRTTAWKQKRRLRPLQWLYAGVERVLGASFLADNLALVWRKQPR
jgi:2-polyprenyl-3-methyl-5-hydroxy-6-metoxy-1,4-benzoquinol methylase